MRLESARHLKQQLLAGVVAPVAAAAAGRRVGRMAGLALPGGGFAFGAQPFGRLPQVQRSLALGVASHGREYRLAIRVQRQALMASRLVDHLVRRAKGEADIRLIGRIDKRERRVPWYRSNTRPLLIGSSIGHVDVTAGTLGAFVARGARVLVLSNNHVLANEDDAAAGDPILQRARLDGGRRGRDQVGRLFASVRLKARGANFVDAALATMDRGIDHDAALLRGIAGGRDRRLAAVGPDFLDEGETVYKIGRTTGATRGRVTAFDLDNVVVNYDRGNLRFDGQMEIEGTGRKPFSDGGDSGSLIVNGAMQAVALLFAGSETGGSNRLGLTYANPIHRVLADLRAVLLS